MDVEPHTGHTPLAITYDGYSETEASFRASDDSTVVGSESTPPSPRQPPAYGDGGAPPRYQEDVVEDDAKERRRIRRTMYIKLLTSILITVLASLIVAAVVARMHGSQVNTHWSRNQTLVGPNYTSIGTASPSKGTFLAQSAMAATADTPQGVQTAVVVQKAEHLNQVLVQ